MYYILNPDKTIKKTDDVLEWGRFFESKNAEVKREKSTFRIAKKLLLALFSWV